MTVEEATPRPGSRAGRLWRGLRRVPGRLSLRTKLITALLALVAIALSVIGFVTVAAFGSFLQNQTDNNLTQLNTQVVNTLTNNNSPFGQHHLPLVPGTTVEFITNTGQIIPFSSATDTATGPRIPVSQSWAQANQGKIMTVPGGQNSSPWRIIEQPGTLTATQQPGILVVGISTGDLNATMTYLTKLDIIVSVAILLVLAVVGIGLVQANLRPLVDIEETAGEIAAGHLNRRVPERDPRTEIGSLGRSLNVMLGQVESAFHAREESEEAAHESEERMRRFVADASHELRTPLTAIRGFAEYYRQRGGMNDTNESPTSNGHSDEGLTPADLDRIMHRVESEAARMGVLVEDLLMLARLDQQRPLDLRPLDVLTLAGDAVQDARMIAPDREIGLMVEPGAAFLVDGDEARLRQVIGNLMSNALTHTPAGTPVEVKISSGDLPARDDRPPVPAVVLDVSDQGPGLTPEQASRVFERFYRADQARNRKSGGSGLGLAIASGLVSAHGGTVTVRTAPGQGATFRVMLPLAPDARGGPDGSDGSDGPDAEDAALVPLVALSISLVLLPYWLVLLHGCLSAARTAASSESRYDAPNRHTCTSSGCSWCSGTRSRQPSASGLVSW
jgi:two-component system, OmpR family, sensor kinase